MGRLRRLGSEKNVSLVAAYLNLGRILDGPAGYASIQQWPYVSVQIGF